MVCAFEPKMHLILLVLFILSIRTEALHISNYQRQFQVEYLKCGFYFCSEQHKIQKSPLDSSQYYIYSLSNGVRFIVVVDPKQTIINTFAMMVEVGSSKDPIDSNGLAHLLEHMMFMGSQDYPNENQLGSYVQSHSGKTNAFTSTGNTVYFFEIDKRQLIGGVSRLVSALRSPLLRSTSVGRQIHAVNQEFQLLKNDPDWQDIILFKRIFGQKGYELFSPGNLKSLNKTAEQLSITLKDFYSHYYSSDITLASISIDSFNQQLLQSIIFQLQSLPNRNIKQQLINSQNIINVEKLPYNVLINHTSPQFHSISLISFPFISSDKMMIEDKGNIIQYYYRQLNRKGGLIEYIRSRYPSVLQMQIQAVNTLGIYYPRIQIGLLIEWGSSDTDNIANQLYILTNNILNTLIVEKECLQIINEELQKQFKLGKYKNSKQSDYLIYLMNSIGQSSDEVMSEVIRSQYKVIEQQVNIQWKSTILQRKSNCIESVDNKTTFIEKYLETVYKVNKISIPLQQSAQYIHQYENFTSNNQKCFTNKYLLVIPNNFSPQILQHKPLYPYWLDKQYSNIIFAQQTTQANQASTILLALHYPQNTNPLILSIISAILSNDQSLKRQGQMATQVMKNIIYGAESTYSTIGVIAIGPIEAVKLYMSQYLIKVSELIKVSQQSFKKALSKVYQEGQGYYLIKKPWEISSETLYRLFYPHLHSIQVMLDNLQNYQYNEFQRELIAFVKEFKPSWGIISSEKQKNSLCEYVKSQQMKFFNIEINSKLTYDKKTICDPGVLHFQLPQQKSNFVLFYVPIGQKNLHNLLISNIIVQSAAQSFFDILRTKKQIAYALYVQPIEISTSGYGIQFFVASSNSNTSVITTQIKHFIKQHFQPITNQKFKQLKSTVLKQITKQYQSTQQLATFLWRILRSRYFYEQDRLKWRQIYQQTINSLTQIGYNKQIDQYMNKNKPLIIQYQWDPQNKDKNRIRNTFQNFKDNKCKIIDNVLIQ